MAEQLRALTTHSDIYKAWSKLRSRMREGAAFSVCAIGFWDQHRPREIRWRQAEGYWSSFEHAAQFQQCRIYFGLGKPRDDMDALIQLDIATNSVTNAERTRFACDSGNTVYLCHTGEINLFRQDTPSPATFASYYPKAEWADVHQPPGYVRPHLAIAAIDSPGMTTKIRNFLDAVAVFKERLRDGSIGYM